MSKIAGSIRRGLQEAVAYAKGEADKNAYPLHVAGICPLSKPKIYFYNNVYPRRQ